MATPIRIQRVVPWSRIQDCALAKSFEEFCLVLKDKHLYDSLLISYLTTHGLSTYFLEQIFRYVPEFHPREMNREIGLPIYIARFLHYLVYMLATRTLRQTTSNVDIFCLRNAKDKLHQFWQIEDIRNAKREELQLRSVLYYLWKCANLRGEYDIMNQRLQLIENIIVSQRKDSRCDDYFKPLFYDITIKLGNRHQHAFFNTYWVPTEYQLIELRRNNHPSVRVTTKENQYIVGSLRTSGWNNSEVMPQPISQILAAYPQNVERIRRRMEDYSQFGNKRPAFDQLSADSLIKEILNGTTDEQISEIDFNDLTTMFSEVSISFNGRQNNNNHRSNVHQNNDNNYNNQDNRYIGDDHKSQAKSHKALDPAYKHGQNNVQQPLVPAGNQRQDLPSLVRRPASKYRKKAPILGSQNAESAFHPISKTDRKTDLQKKDQKTEKKLNEKNFNNNSKEDNNQQQQQAPPPSHRQVSHNDKNNNHNNDHFQHSQNQNNNNENVQHSNTHNQDNNVESRQEYAKNVERNDEVQSSDLVINGNKNDKNHENANNNGNSIHNTSSQTDDDIPRSERERFDQNNYYPSIKNYQDIHHNNNNIQNIDDKDHHNQQLNNTYHNMQHHHVFNNNTQYQPSNIINDNHNNGLIPSNPYIPHPSANPQPQQSYYTTNQLIQQHSQLMTQRQRDWHKNHSRVYRTLPLGGAAFHDPSKPSLAPAHSRWLTPIQQLATAHSQQNQTLSRVPPLPSQPSGILPKQPTTFSNNYNTNAPVIENTYNNQQQQCQNHNVISSTINPTNIYSSSQMPQNYGSYQPSQHTSYQMHQQTMIQPQAPPVPIHSFQQPAPSIPNPSFPPQAPPVHNNLVSQQLSSHMHPLYDHSAPANGYHNSQQQTVPPQNGQQQQIGQVPQNQQPPNGNPPPNRQPPNGQPPNGLPPPNRQPPLPPPMNVQVQNQSFQSNSQQFQHPQNYTFYKDNVIKKQAAEALANLKFNGSGSRTSVTNKIYALMEAYESWLCSWNDYFTEREKVSLLRGRVLTDPARTEFNEYYVGYTNSELSVNLVFDWLIYQYGNSQFYAYHRRALTEWKIDTRITDDKIVQVFLRKCNRYNRIVDLFIADPILAKEKKIYEVEAIQILRGCIMRDRTYFAKWITDRNGTLPATFDEFEHWLQNYYTISQNVEQYSIDFELATGKPVWNDYRSTPSPRATSDKYSSSHQRSSSSHGHSHSSSHSPSDKKKPFNVSKNRELPTIHHMSSTSSRSSKKKYNEQLNKKNHKLRLAGQYKATKSKSNYGYKSPTRNARSHQRHPLDNFRGRGRSFYRGRGKFNRNYNNYNNRRQSRSRTRSRSSRFSRSSYDSNRSRSNSRSYRSRSPYSRNSRSKSRYSRSRSRYPRSKSRYPRSKSRYRSRSKNKYSGRPKSRNARYYKMENEETDQNGNQNNNPNTQPPPKQENTLNVMDQVIARDITASTDEQANLNFLHSFDLRDDDPPAEIDGNLMMFRCFPPNITNNDQQTDSKQQPQVLHLSDREEFLDDDLTEASDMILPQPIRNAFTKMKDENSAKLTANNLREHTLNVMSQEEMAFSYDTVNGVQIIRYPPTSRAADIDLIHVADKQTSECNWIMKIPIAHPKEIQGIQDVYSDSGATVAVIDEDFVKNRGMLQYVKKRKTPLRIKTGNGVIHLVEYLHVYIYAGEFRIVCVRAFVMPGFGYHMLFGSPVLRLLGIQLPKVAPYIPNQWRKYLANEDKRCYRIKAKPPIHLGSMDNGHSTKPKCFIDQQALVNQLSSVEKEVSQECDTPYEEVLTRSNGELRTLQTVTTNKDGSQKTQVNVRYCPTRIGAIQQIQLPNNQIIDWSKDQPYEYDALDKAIIASELFTLDNEEKTKSIYQQPSVVAPDQRGFNEIIRWESTPEEVKAAIIKIKSDTLPPPSVEYLRGKYTDEEIARVQKLLTEYDDIFAKYRWHRRRIKGYEYKFKLRDDCQDEVIYTPQYMLSNDRRLVVLEYTLANLQNGLLKPDYKSPHNTPIIVIVKDKDKPSRRMRTATDFSYLNSFMEDVTTRMPTAKFLFNKLKRPGKISVFDFKNYYECIPLAKECQPYSHVTLPYGNKGYIYTAGTYGYKTITKCAQQIGNDLVRRLNANAAIFVDDIFIKHRPGADIDEILGDCKKLFREVRELNGLMSPNKAFMACTKVIYMGKLFTEYHSGMTEPMRQKILRFKKPTSVKEIRSFTNTINYVLEFIPYCAEFKALINLCSSPKTIRQWGPLQDEAFARIQELVKNAKLLHHPTTDGKFCVQTDASFWATSGVLYQWQPNPQGSPSHHWVIIEFYSRQIPKHLLDQPINVKECLALCYACQHWRHWLLYNEFWADTDNKSVLAALSGDWLKGSDMKKRPIYQTIIYTLCEFNMILKHLKGVTPLVDYLSREGSEVVSNNVDLPTVNTMLANLFSLQAIDEDPIPTLSNMFKKLLARDLEAPVSKDTNQLIKLRLRALRRGANLYSLFSDKIGRNLQPKEELCVELCHQCNPSSLFKFNEDLGLLMKLESTFKANNYSLLDGSLLISKNAKVRFGRVQVFNYSYSSSTKKITTSSPRKPILKLWRFCKIASNFSNGAFGQQIKAVKCREAETLEDRLTAAAYGRYLLDRNDGQMMKAIEWLERLMPDAEDPSTVARNMELLHEVMVDHAQRNESTLYPLSNTDAFNEVNYNTNEQGVRQSLRIRNNNTKPNYNLNNYFEKIHENDYLATTIENMDEKEEKMIITDIDEQDIQELADIHNILRQNLDVENLVTAQAFAAAQKEDEICNILYKLCQDKTQVTEAELNKLKNQRHYLYQLYIHDKVEINTNDIVVVIINLVADYHRHRETHVKYLVPKSRIFPIIAYIHNQLHTNHRGIQATLTMLKQRFYWDGMATDVRDYVRVCRTCIAAKGGRPQSQGELAPFKASEHGDLVHTDFLGPIFGELSILLFVDSFSGYKMILPCTSQSAEVVVLGLLNHWAPFHGFPLALLSDNGSAFISDMNAYACKLFGIKQIFCGYYSPTGNAKAERVNIEINKDIRIANILTDESITTDQRTNVIKLLLPAIQMRLNNQNETFTQICPNQLVVGKVLRDIPDVTLKMQEIPNLQQRMKELGDTPSDIRKFKLMRRLIQDLRLAKKSYKERSKKYVRYYKSQYDKKQKPHNFVVGQEVAYYCGDQSTPFAKYRARWLCPFKIVKIDKNKVSITIQCEANGEELTTTSNRLKPFHRKEFLTEEEFDELVKDHNEEQDEFTHHNPQRSRLKKKKDQQILDNEHSMAPNSNSKLIQRPKQNNNNKKNNKNLRINKKCNINNKKKKSMKKKNNDNLRQNDNNNNKKQKNTNKKRINKNSNDSQLNKKYATKKTNKTDSRQNNNVNNKRKNKIHSRQSINNNNKDSNTKMKKKLTTTKKDTNNNNNNNNRNKQGRRKKNEKNKRTQLNLLLSKDDEIGNINYYRQILDDVY